MCSTAELSPVRFLLKLEYVGLELKYVEIDKSSSLKYYGFRQYILDLFLILSLSKSLRNKNLNLQKSIQLY